MKQLTNHQTAIPLLTHRNPGNELMTQMHNTLTRDRNFLHIVPHTGLYTWLGLLLALLGLLAPGRAGAVGTLTPLATTAPGQVGLMRLLSDGTVMAQNYNGSNWF